MLRSEPFLWRISDDRDCPRAKDSGSRCFRLPFSDSSLCIIKTWRYSYVISACGGCTFRCSYVQYRSMITRSPIFLPSDSESSQITGVSELFAPPCLLDFSRCQGGVSGSLLLQETSFIDSSLTVECQFQRGNRETALSSIWF